MPAEFPPLVPLTLHDLFSTNPTVENPSIGIFRGMVFSLKYSRDNFGMGFFGIPNPKSQIPGLHFKTNLIFSRFLGLGLLRVVSQNFKKDSRFKMGTHHIFNEKNIKNSWVILINFDFVLNENLKKILVWYWNSPGWDRFRPLKIPKKWVFSWHEKSHKKSPLLVYRNISKNRPYLPLGLIKCLWRNQRIRLEEYSWNYSSVIGL